MYDEVVVHVIPNLDDQVDAAGFKVLTWIHVDSPMAQGLSMGTASHAVGTATAMSRSPKYGAFASLGLTMNGILTALLTPLILEWIGVI